MCHRRAHALWTMRRARPAVESAGVGDDDERGRLGIVSKLIDRRVKTIRGQQRLLSDHGVGRRGRSDVTGVHAAIVVGLICQRLFVLRPGLERVFFQLRGRRELAPVIDRGRRANSRFSHRRDRCKRIDQPRRLLRDRRALHAPKIGKRKPGHERDQHAQFDRDQICYFAAHRFQIILPAPRLPEKAGCANCKYRAALCPVGGGPIVVLFEIIQFRGREAQKS